MANTALYFSSHQYNATAIFAMDLSVTVDGLRENITLTQKRYQTQC